MDVKRYSNLQKALHWITAGLVLALAYTGLDYYYEWTGESVIKVHQAVGQALILVLILRIFVRVRSDGQRHENHKQWERILAGLVHLCLYLSLILFVCTGYVAASALSNNILILPLDIGFARGETGEAFLETHYFMKWVLLALFSLHFAGALKHLFIDRDSTFSSTWFARKGK